MRNWLRIWGIRIEFGFVATVYLIGLVLSVQSCAN